MVEVAGVFEEVLVVEGGAAGIAFDDEAEVVPLTGGDGDIRAGEEGAVAVGDLVEADVVLQRVGAEDEVVVLVVVADDDAGGLVDLAGDGASHHVAPE